jgi:hypothetical protein
MAHPIETELTPLAVGDQVVALYAIGLLRPRVARGTLGVVAGFSPGYEVEVRFSNGRVELVHPDVLGRAQS